MKGTFHIVTAFGEEWLNAEDYRSVETLDYINTDQGVAQLVGEVRVQLYPVHVGIGLSRPPLELRAKSVEFIPENIIPKSVFVVGTTDWNDETEIEGIFVSKSSAEAFKACQPDGPYRRRINEYELK